MAKKVCPRCKNHAVKNGFQDKKQCYKCLSCNKKFQERYIYNAYNHQTDHYITLLLKESCGVRSISRILKISKKTVLSRILKISNQIKSPRFLQTGCKYEIDEVWTFIQRKENFTWITYALERKSKNVIAFFVGNKSKEDIKPLIDQVLLLNPGRIYTDRLNIYPSLVPATIHRRFQYCTNIIERNNLTLRNRIKRLSRKTICFSKSKIYLEAHLKIYFRS